MTRQLDREKIRALSQPLLSVDGSREDPVSIGRVLPAIQTDELFNVSLIAVTKYEGMYDNLALNLGDPIPYILNICYEKKLSIQCAGDEGEP